jgi:uncharacterized membrane protein YadS
MTTPASSRASGFYLKEDWWAVGIGLVLVVAGYLLFLNGASLRWLAVLPPRWTDGAQVTADLATNWPRYGAQFAFWAVGFGAALSVLGHSFRAFLPSFALVYLAAYAIFVLGQWDRAVYYNLEPPLVALVLGLLLANTLTIPAWLRTGLRGELYVKTGIVLLGATLPLSLIVLAGPVAILQASIVSIVTFTVIFWTAVKLGLDRRFAAVLGVGGAVCGVSAAIAVAGAVGARKDHAPVAIAAVILWAIAMIFVLPFAALALHLPTGVAGAWIGTSEFADAAGIAAAQAYGGFAAKVGGTPEQAVAAFTLMKVVGRDVWIGIWAVVLAFVATTRWSEEGANSAPDLREIWRRFPKFVIGFLVASAFISLVTAHLPLAAYNKLAVPRLVAPIKDLRSWAFIFCFFSIGLTTRFRDLAATGRRPMLAFAAGVAVNIVLGFVLSVHIFGTYWQHLGQ